MKKITLLFAALAISIVALAGPASATSNGQPDADNKKVTLCHATGSETNPYTKITISVMAFYNAGHIDHAGDIWEAFSYTTKGGDVVNVPAQGDTSLLAFDDCSKPKVDQQIAVPSPVFADECGTEHDVFSVAPGLGYTVHPVVKGGDLTQSITVTADEGFVFADGTKSVTFSKPAFTNIDCGLPQTGGPASFNTTGGIAALAGIVLIGGFLLTPRRRTTV